MDNSTYIAYSGQNARERQMDVLANNIANQSTPGYKAERTTFAQYLVPSQDDTGDSDAYVNVTGAARDMSQGPLSHTGNSFDLALNGDGFFEVSMPNGSTAYTRNGHLTLDPQGELVTSAGYVLQGEGGAPIVLPAGTSDVTIDKDGTVATPKGTLGRVSVVKFDDPQTMLETGGGLFTTDQTANPATGTTVEQGTIEESNVQPVLEMTRLMQATHDLGNAKSFSDGEHKRIQNAIDRLGKTL